MLTYLKNGKLHANLIVRLAVIGGFCAGLLMSSSIGSLAQDAVDSFRDCELCPEMVELPLGS